MAQYGDACNIFEVGLTKDVLQRKLNVLRNHCQAIGRSYAEIEKTTIDGIAITSNGAIVALHQKPPSNTSVAWSMPRAARPSSVRVTSQTWNHSIFWRLRSFKIIPEVEKIEVVGR